MFIFLPTDEMTSYKNEYAFLIHNTPTSLVADATYSGHFVYVIYYMTIQKSVLD